jgi:hypothetical protein
MYWELNGQELETFTTNLNVLLDKIIFSSAEITADSKVQLLKEIKLEKQKFIRTEIDGKMYLFQEGLKYIDLYSRNLAEGVLIVEDNPDCEIAIKECTLFSEAKYNALEKLENYINTETPIQYVNKLKINLSVADISLFFRLLYDENILEVDNNTDLYRFIAQSFTSKQSDNISDKSVKNKFLTPDSTAISNLNALLVNLRTHLKNID